MASPRKEKRRERGEEGSRSVRGGEGRKELIKKWETKENEIS